MEILINIKRTKTDSMIDSEIQTNLQKYYSIVRDHVYNLPVDRSKAISMLRVKQEAWSNDALQFIYQCYIKDKYFDELDMYASDGEVLTEAKFVVNVVFPGYLQSLHDIMQIMLDFDNMIALSPSNYIAWKQRTLQLNDEQKKLIEHKERIIISRYNINLADVIFYRSKSNSNVEVQRSIKQICEDIENYLLHVVKSTEKKEKNKPVEAWDVETKQLVKVFESVKEAVAILKV